MNQTFRVRVAKDDLVFCAAHFITYEGNHCERLHGHNFRVTAEVTGPLDDNQYVLNFLDLRASLAKTVGQLDHRVLLAEHHPLIKLSISATEVVATFAERRWVFPRGDCVLLPIANTTSELLASYIAARLAESIPASERERLHTLRVEIDECFGNVASCEIAL